MVPPAVTVAGPLLSTERSADPRTSVSTLSSLFVGSGSAVVESMSALLVMLPGWFGAVTTIVMVVVEPATQVARSQVTEMLALLLQVQPPLEVLTETNETPAGSASVTLTFCADDGPVLATSRLYVTVPPAVTVAGPLLTTERSADPATVVLTASSLFVGSGSAVVESMSALFVRVVGWFGAVTTMVNVVAEPAVQSGRSHVTEMLALLVHVHPPFEAVTETKVTPAGSVSETETVVASEGPLLVTSRS